MKENENEIINRGIINININEVVFDNVRVVGQPIDIPGIPAVDNKLLGVWDMVDDNWVVGAPVNETEMFSDSRPYTKFILHAIDFNSTDISPIFQTHTNTSTAVSVNILYENGNLYKSFDGVFFRQSTYDPDVYYFIIPAPGYIPNLWNEVYTFNYSYPGSEAIIEEKKDFIFEKNIQDYIAIGTEADSDLISDILVQGKDTFIRINYYLDATNIPDDTPVSVTMILGHTGSDTHEKFYSKVDQISAFSNSRKITGNFLSPVKLANYDWFQFTVEGTPIVDENLKIRFEYENIR